MGQPLEDPRDGFLYLLSPLPPLCLLPDTLHTPGSENSS